MGCMLFSLDFLPSGQRSNYLRKAHLATSFPSINCAISTYNSCFFVGLLLALINSEAVCLVCAAKYACDWELRNSCPRFLHVLATPTLSPGGFLKTSTFFAFLLKAHGQISEKRCFEKYCSCDKACQFSTLQGTSDGVIQKT